MDFKIALSEVKGMKQVPLAQYMSQVGSGSIASRVSLSEELPETLDKSHEQLTNTRALLSENNLFTGRVVVKNAVDSDIARIGQMVRDMKITPAVAHKVITLCERKRANQLIRLAEGDPEGAGGEDGDVGQYLDALGDLPSKSADQEPTAGAVPGDDPTKKPADGGDYDEQLMSLAKQIQQQTPGMSLQDAMIQAETQLGQNPGAMGPVGGK